MSESQGMTETRLVVFKLAEEDYGVNIEQVHTVEKVMPITRVPRAPHFVEGVINLRGEVVPVISLRKRLGLPEKPIDESTHIVVVLVDGQMTGMLVDEISQVLTLPVDSIQPAEQVIGGIKTGYLQGVGKWDDKLIVMMDLKRVLDAGK